MAAIAWRAVDKTAVEERPTAVTLSPAMAKIIATAHIVLSISATILVGVRYAEAWNLEFVRTTMTLRLVGAIAR